MLFHADKALKENLFQMYKKDAADYVNKKNEEKAKKIIEEKAYLDSIRQQETAWEDRMRYEKMKRVNETMDEYTKMLSRKNEEKFMKRSKLGDVNINTYGVRSNMGGANEIQCNPGENSYGVRSNMGGANEIQCNPGENAYGLRPNLESVNDFQSNPGGVTGMSTYPVEAQNIPRQELPTSRGVSLSPKSSNVMSESSMSNLQNMSEYDAFIRNQKLGQQKMYKDFLDSQVNQRSKISSQGPFANINIQNYQQKFNIAGNPYSSKNYEIGHTSLAHNPIVNPINNFGYNKYLSFGQAGNNQSISAWPMNSKMNVNVNNNNPTMSSSQCYNTQPQEIYTGDGRNIFNGYGSIGNMYGNAQDAFSNPTNAGVIYGHMNQNYHSYQPNSYQATVTPSGEKLRQAGNSLLR